MGKGGGGVEDGKVGDMGHGTGGGWVGSFNSHFAPENRPFALPPKRKVSFQPIPVFQVLLLLVLGRVDGCLELKNLMLL